MHVDSSPKACSKPFEDLDLCQGSNIRAMDTFNQHSIETSCSSVSSGVGTVSRKTLSPYSAAGGADHIIEIFRLKCKMKILEWGALNKVLEFKQHEN